jgi:PEGA domain
VGPDNLNSLDELKSLEQKIDSVTDLAGLKPIFFRLEEIAKENINDFDVQLAVGDLKQHLVNRGTKLKETKDAKPAVPAPPPVPPPLPAPPSSTFAPPPLAPVPPPPAAPGPPSLPPAVRMPQEPSVPSIPAPPQSPQGAWATTENAPVSTSPPPVRPPIPIPAKPPVSPVSKPPVPKPAPVKPPTPRHSSQLNNPVVMGALLGLLIVAIVGSIVFVHKRRQRAALATAIPVQIATTPPGASVRVNGDPQCTSNCSLTLAPGNYQITAFLDGYEPAASGVAVNPGQPVTVNLTLEPQAQSLRILTDLDQGQVAIDDQPPADLQEGQFVVDRVLPGAHTVKVTGKGGEASFSFEVADAKTPSIGPVAARNLNAILVSSFVGQAHVVTNNGPLKLAVNGQAEGDAGPAGVDLKTFQSGVDELVLGEGKDQVSVKEFFGQAPMLTAFLRSAGVTTGTLIVSTGEDDVHVFVNNRDIGRRTQRGQVRIQTLGPVSVRVSKDGFEAPPAQTGEVKKGAETRLDFTLKAAAKFSTLQISGGTPGAEVSIDQRNVGIIGPDGTFSNGTIAPGDHVVELRRDQYTTRRLQRTFRAGQTVTLAAGDAILAANPSPVPAPPPPKAEPAPAPTVARKEVAAPKAGTMDDWEDPAAWKLTSGVWLHQGKGFVPYKLTPNGTFTFTVQLVKGGSLFRGGKISWCFEYLDAKNYALYEMDNKNFWAKVVTKGKALERTHVQLKDLEKQKSFTIQIDVTPEHVVHKMFTGGEWMNLDSWAEVGRNFTEGKFGFLIQGNDEIGLADFKFQPK